MLDPIQKRSYGRTALLVAAIFMGVSAAAGTATMVRRNEVSQKAAATDAECVSRIKQIGASTVSQNGDRIVAQWGSLEGGYSAIGDMSAAALSCPGWTMEAACVGQECSTAGASLTVKRLTVE